MLSRAFRTMASRDAAAAGAGAADPVAYGGVARKTYAHQWIVLDGDLDPEWVESMNTVMDDNRTLTLASGERIPLAASMRLLLETDSMVKRGGRREQRKRQGSARARRPLALTHPMSLSLSF